MCAMEFILKALPSIETLVLDVDLENISSVVETAVAHKVSLRYIRGASSDTAAPDGEAEVTSVPPQAKSAFFDSFIVGETRLLLGAELSCALGGEAALTYRVATRGRALRAANALPARRLRLLHLVGSATSRFYDGISTYYADECLRNIGHDGRFEHVIARVTVSNGWVVAPASEISDVRAELDSAGMSLSEAIAKIERLGVDVVVPHMFDYVGLTSFRALADILRVPLVGCTADALALSTHKARTNAIAASAGVPVPPSQLVSGGALPTLELPIVVKPVEEDNSLGVRVVREASELRSAVDAAAGFGDGAVLCEKFIPPGREMRVGLVETCDGGLDMLALIEYDLSDGHPIREESDKVQSDKSGMVTTLASGGRMCPAEVDDMLKEKLFRYSSLAHRALGCRDYSIFDWRVDPDGEPFMLETCLYCSFAPKSVLVSMMAAVGIPTNVLFERLVDRALTRRMIESDETEEKGMKPSS